jgi:hypothetical protein
VATTSRFQDYLDEKVAVLSRRMLYGLVRSCHARWSAPFAAGAIAHRVQQRLQTSPGSDRILARWREHADMLLGPQGHCSFADSLLSARVPLKQHCDAWALEETSAYTLEAARYAVDLCQTGLERDEAVRAYFLTALLPWIGWPLQDFHAAIGATILHPIAASESGFQEALSKFVLSDTRLGDPRLSRNTKNWIGIPEAHQRFLQWLSTADMHFFFEHVLPYGQDPQRRKAFWLRYVSRVQRSRPLLNNDDEVRLRTLMRSQHEQMGHVGHISGRVPSAFLLDFGAVVVVEFSRVNNACYLYEKSNVQKVIPDFWTHKPFTRDGLKKRLLAAETISHTTGWQTHFAQSLARYGIRPA